MNIKNPCIKMKKSIDEKDYKNINKLKNICDLYDKTILKLELDFKFNNKTNNKSQFNEFMYYDEEELVAYIGVNQFNSEEIEVNGMVHPEYRRMKLFTNLYYLVIDEWKKRDVNFLLLVDNLSKSGIEFIKQTEAKYKNSEYEMELTKNFSYECNNIVLVKAENKDALEISKQNKIFFGYDDNDSALQQIDETNGNITFMAKLDNKIIGKVRIELSNNTGYIYGLGVLPDYRNQGYGKEILNLAINEIKSKDVDKIKLQVLVDNNNALKLYKKCGFTVTSTIDYYEINKN